MGIEGRFTDCRTAQESTGSVRVTIPRPIAEEFDIEDGDPILFNAEEGGESAEIRRPSKRDD